jgi:hypothetical protein
MVMTTPSTMKLTGNEMKIYLTFPASPAGSKLDGETWRLKSEIFI